MGLCKYREPNLIKYIIITNIIYIPEDHLDTAIRVAGVTSYCNISMIGSIIVMSMLSSLYSTELRRHPLNIQNDINAHANNIKVPNAYS